MSDFEEVMKRCPACGETKPHSGFNRNRTASCGLTSWCKTCCANRTAARYAAKREAEGKTVRPRTPPAGAPPMHGRWGDKSLVPDGHRYCPTCCTVKTLSHFARDTNATGGVRFQCKACFSIEKKEYRTKNADIINDKQRARRQALKQEMTDDEREEERRIARLKYRATRAAARRRA